MRERSERPGPWALRTGTVIHTAVAAALLLASPWPAFGQLKGLASLERINRRLSGRIVDHTANHGADHRIDSPILGMPRDLYVYLPPGYSPRNAHPLILYYHLARVDEHIIIGTDWIVQLDRMIARGEMPAVVVACPDGTITGKDCVLAPHSLYVNGCRGRFQDHVVEEVLPFIRRTYTIRPEPEAHALLGLSAGGFGAMNLALKRRDLFASVATLAGPLNLRYSNRDGDYREDFDPATYRWKEHYDPDEVVAVFFLGLRRVRAKSFLRPVFGQGPDVLSRVKRENPADLLSTAGTPSGTLAIYINYPARDDWNFDAQSESFAWLAAQRGVEVTVECDPKGKHNLRYFRANHEPAYRWLGRHLLPPIALRAH